MKTSPKGCVEAKWRSPFIDLSTLKPTGLYKQHGWSTPSFAFWGLSRWRQTFGSSLQFWPLIKQAWWSRSRVMTEAKRSRFIQNLHTLFKVGKRRLTIAEQMSIGREWVWCQVPATGSRSLQHVSYTDVSVGRTIGRLRNPIHTVHQAFSRQCWTRHNLPLP